MKSKTPYKNLGYRPREDGTFIIYEINWKHVDDKLVERAIKNKSQSAKLGPLRVRISNTRK